METATEGRVKIKFSATSLAAPQQQWEMVTQGVADAAYLFNGFHDTEEQARTNLALIATTLSNTLDTESRKDAKAGRASR